MGVHDQIRPPTGLGKGNILFVNDQPTDTLLPMPTRELIPQLWSSHFPHNSFDDFGRLLICSDNDAVDMEVGAGGLEIRGFVVP